MREQVHGFWKRNGLSVTLFLMFAAAWLMHLFSSWKDAAQEAQAKGEGALSLLQFMQEPEFWFDSNQNWQSEFLAVASIVLLSIFLRQIGSAQSKGVTEPNSKTGA
ncbi:DUF6766 family protein [Deinococcus sp. Marseille-Q6407]|uniref:DUF6766 family protein n=1 Tax=Deinococcus sp. Marseille-Q6407 TaxID=2969223 RepID=UPI0021C0A915|nr:DUF6766 family protein [Deinococcus sp. Marseille-Q6407]